MKKQQYIMPRASVIIIKNKLLLGASNQYSGGNRIDLNPETMDEGTGGDAASRRGVWDQWEEEEY